MGIRPNRSTIDNIFTTGQILRSAMNIIQICIIYYTQDLDSEYGNKIIECLVQYIVPAKLRTLIELPLINEYTAEFEVESGVNKEIHYQELYLV